MARPSRCEHGGQRVLGHRPGEQVALRLLAAELEGPLELARGLDALGHRRDAQRPGDGHHRADQARVRAVLVEAVHEAAVDLDLVDRQLLEVGERRVPGAEVVDGHPDTARAQGGEHLGDEVHVLHHGRLGQLDAQRRGRRAGGGESVRPMWSITRSSRSCRADRLTDIVSSWPSPISARRRARVAQASVDHPVAELDDQAGVLGDRDEDVGADLAEGRDATTAAAPRGRPPDPRPRRTMGW